MAAFDFKEIPRPDIAAGQQDMFEFFARDCLEHLGYQIISGPDRGPDGGRDLIVEETRTGVGGETRLRWLVSCKHKAHTGGSVGVTDEQDLGDRLKAHNCVGFIGFCSTPLSAALGTKLDRLGVPVQKFDPAKIERELLRSSGGVELARRYFPESATKWQRDNPELADVMIQSLTFRCNNCGRELLTPEQLHRSIVVIGEHYARRPRDEEKRYVEYIYVCCKGACDRALQVRYRRRDISDGWEDLRDVCTPTVYLKWIMACLNELHEEVRYKPEAFQRLKDLLIAAFPRVARSLTSKEREHVKRLLVLPDVLGGLG